VLRNARADQARRKSVRSGDETDIGRQLPPPVSGYYEPLSDSGGRHWSIVATLIHTAKLNDVEPLAWLADVLKRIVSGQTKHHELDQLLPWNWKPLDEPQAISSA
jgi:predicted DNA-binding protein